jgi:signal transduction histidine kinase
MLIDVLRPLEKLKKERGLEVKTEFSEVKIEAPTVHLEMLLRNLLENAVKYAKQNSTVEVIIKKQENGTDFSVWNDSESSLGIGTERDLSAWFEPFFRLDASRNSKTGGNGLGLAICASIARANNWSITLESKNGGVHASVFFPSPKLLNTSKTLISQQIP